MENIEDDERYVSHYGDGDPLKGENYSEHDTREEDRGER